MSKATLKFGPGDMSGFTSHTAASFNDVSPAKILRELLQNSLDAAVEAGERTAKVRFEITLLEGRQVPDLAGYKRAFSAAVKYHERQAGGDGLADPAQQVVDTINGALDSVDAGKHYSLSVLDNGIGFDHKRMTSILSDGSSAKSEGAAGSYGVGHFSAVCASDLRYLLYGGVSKNDKRIASGFTILAGRSGKGNPRSARGFLVKDLLGGAKKLFQFPARAEIPPIVGRALSKIRKKWGHGSVVMIPAFNYFGRDHGWLAEIVTRVTAFNFSAAVHAGELVVEVDETALQGGTTARVDAGNLGDILSESGSRERAFRSDSWYRGLRPSGQSAWAAYQTISQGQRAVVPSAIGAADVCILVPAPAGRTRLDLFRNGMWITEDIPELSPSVFAEWEPFHAVLVPVQGTELHRLVRKAEGPMHDQLSENLLKSVEREQFRTALRAIAAWLKDQVPKTQTETYTPDDFLVVTSGGDGGGGGGASYSMWGRPVVVQRARMSQQRAADRGGTETGVEPENGSGRGGRKRPPKANKRRSRPLPFRSTGVPGRRGQYHLEIECKEPVTEVLLRFRIDENTDATCDRLWPDEDVVLKSFVATGRGDAKVSGQLEDDNTTIRLRGLTESTYKIVIEYDAPAGFDEAVHAPVFRMDLHRP